MKSLYILFILMAIAASGCKKFVEIGPPKNQTVTATIFDNNASATSALTSIYAQMVISSAANNWTYLLPLYTGLYGDELTSYANVMQVQQIYTNGLEATGASTNAFWNESYNLIYQANAIIEGLQHSNSINTQVKQQLMAEAKFIRAFWYFYLTNFFGDIPLITGTDYSINASASRSSQVQVYRQIINDLHEAENGLNSNYIDITDTSVTADRFRPNRYADEALLARVYLYTAKYDSAELTATEVLRQAALYDTATLDDVFKINNKEVIWQLMTPGAAVTNNTFEGFDFILSGAPTTNIVNSSAISPQLIAAFEPGDNRKNVWIGSSTDSTVTPAATYFFPYKYKLKTSTLSSQEYSVALRLAEQYLIRAEARAQLKDISGAQADLNIIRHRAGLANTTAADQAALLTAILHERQVELFCEYGHRWLDLKRTDQVNTVMQQVDAIKNGIWNNNKALWPIPQTEITNDLNLKQNPGY